MIETERLVLRDWQETDRSFYRALNADPEVRQHFATTLDASASDSRFALVQEWSRTLGFSFWAVERKSDRALLGNAGLKPLTIAWPEPADIEIGWMFAKDHWGQGYAREAAEAALAFGLTLAPRVIAMTTLSNAPSWGLMQRLGMVRAPELDCEHPEVPVGHPLRPQIVYAKQAA